MMSERGAVRTQIASIRGEILASGRVPVEWDAVYVLALSLCRGHGVIGYDRTWVAQLVADEIVRGQPAE